MAKDDFFERLLNITLDSLFPVSWVKWSDRFQRNTTEAQIEKESAEAKTLYKEYMKP